MPKTFKRILSKADRRARRAGPRSEFILMCEQLAATEAQRRERAERVRREAERRRPQGGARLPAPRRPGGPALASHFTR